MKTHHAFQKVIFSLNTLTFASTQILLFTLLPVLSEKLTLPLSSVIGSFTLGTVLFLWGAPYWSHSSNTLGRGKVLSYGLFGLSLSFGLVACLLITSTSMSHSLILSILILSRLIYGTMASGIVPVAQLARAELAKESKFSSLLGHSLSLNVGRALGPLFVIFGKDHLEYLFIAIVLWTLLLAALNFSLKGQTYLTPPSEISSDKTFILPLIVAILFTTYTGILHSSLGGTLGKIFDLTGSEASHLMAQLLLFGSLVMILTQTLARMFLKRRIKLVLNLGILNLMIGTIIFALMQSHEVLWLSILFITSGISLVYPGHLALIHETYQEEDISKKVGMLSCGNTVGYAIGGAVASIFMGLEIQYISLLVVMLLSLLALFNASTVKI